MAVAPEVPSRPTAPDTPKTFEDRFTGITRRSLQRLLSNAVERAEGAELAWAGTVRVVCPNAGCAFGELTIAVDEHGAGTKVPDVISCPACAKPTVPIEVRTLDDRRERQGR